MKITDFVNLKNPANAAVFNRFRCGTLYYRVRPVGNDDDIYEFTVPVDDIGNATFNKFEKASTLMRYIRKAIEANELIKVTDE